MREEKRPDLTEPFDAIVIGAGICGVVFLKYALEKGLRCVALEKQDDVGGLWKWLPAWQDIQNRKEDFAINDVPLDGAEQPDVLRFVHEWVERYDLAPLIELRCEVTSVSWQDERWQVQTNRGPFRAKYLIAATGVQNELLPHLGSLVRSIDYPNLFFIGMSLTESTSATPFFAAIEAKSIVAHILGRCKIPKQNVPHHIAYWKLFKHFASFDRANYPRLWWRIKYFLLACWYALLRRKTVKV